MTQTYTVDDIAQLLQVSKLTVYDLIKKGDIPAYRVGRQMRVDALDLEHYKTRGKKENAVVGEDEETLRSVVVSGQDKSLDILARTLEGGESNHRTLRSYVGSLDGLISMYQGKIDIVSTHLFDGDTNTYNIPYIRKLLVSKSFVVLRFIKREVGLYVPKGNPKHINTWTDLKKPQIKLLNREAGAGARVLLDEQLRLYKIKRDEVNGYYNEETSHLAIASAVANGHADVGVGIERTAQNANIDFVPLITENYDLVILKNRDNLELINHIQSILKSSQFKEELNSFNYKFDEIGKIIWEQ